MSNYRKTMTEALREMYSLDESVIDKVKEIDKRKSAKKIDGVMVDSFTASAISQVYDKVNAANKKKMEKLPIKKLADLAMKFIKHGEEFVPEEVELDEGTWELPRTSKQKAGLKKALSKPIKLGKEGETARNVIGPFIGDDELFDDLMDAGDENPKSDARPIIKKAMKRLGIKEEVELDEADDFKPHMMYDPKTGKGYKADTMDDHLRMKKMGYTHDAPKKEEVELDEVDRSTYSDRMKKYTAMLKDAEKEKPLDKEWIKLLKRRIKRESDDERKKLGMSEDVDLDEGKMQDMWQKKNAQSLSVGPFELLRGKSGVHTIKRSGKVLGDFSYDSDADNFVANMKGMRGQWTGNDIDSLFTHLQKVHKEEVELDENKLKDLVIKGQDLEAYAKKSGGIDKKDMMNVAAMLKKGDKSGALKYAKKLDTDPKEYILNLMGEEVEVEESAASDARRAMRRDKDFSRRDSADDDTDATADDVKGASKNIMMQMRKAQSLNGRFDVEFADGKKVKIPAKMAIAVQQKYNKMRRPAEKEKFQAKIAKSYRDMLSALKEAVSPAQQAAIAISKKERGEKPKKESVLDRIDKKIKEKNDG